MFSDKLLTCVDCNSDFLFSAGEQQYFSVKRLTNEPKRCASCRVLFRAKRLGKSPDSTAEVICAECGDRARVSFRPSGQRPVYCTRCFMGRKEDLTIRTAV